MAALPAPTPFHQPVLSSALQAIRAQWQSHPHQALVPGQPLAMIHGLRLPRAVLVPWMERFPTPYPPIPPELTGQEP